MDSQEEATPGMHVDPSNLLCLRYHLRYDSFRCSCCRAPKVLIHHDFIFVHLKMPVIALNLISGILNRTYAKVESSGIGQNVSIQFATPSTQSNLLLTISLGSVVFITGAAVLPRFIIEQLSRLLSA